MDDDQLQYINTFPTVRKKRGQSLHSWRSESARVYREWARSEEGQAQIKRLREMREEEAQATKLARDLAARNDLSEEVESDVRTSLLAAAEAGRREVYSTILGLRSSERVGMRLVWATWGLAFFTAALVGATIVLVVVTLKVHG